KRERRFRWHDLQQYLAGGAESAGGEMPADESGRISLGFAGIEVPDGAHLTHLYFDDEEALGLQASYVRHGLEKGETVLVIAPDRSREVLWRTLERDGLKVMAFMDRHRLYHDGGRETPAELAAYIGQIAASAPGRLRLLGDMAWARRKQWPLELIRSVEETTNTRLRAGHLFLCQYGLAEFSGRETMMAVETHRYAIYKGRLRENLLV
ncbi:MAG: MEDS domain-containing protein, partial [Desulfurivibrio sp.]